MQYLMPSEEENVEAKQKEHTPAPPSEKIWMDVYLDQDGRVAKHDWCLDTGIIKIKAVKLQSQRVFTLQY